MNPRQIVAELRRRKVLRLMGMYLVAGWVAIQVADTLVPLLDLPPGLARGTALLVIFGIPLAFALAWVYDITRDGVVRTPAAATPAADAATAETTTSATAATGAAAAPATRSAQTASRSRAAAFMGLGMLISLTSFGAYAYIGAPATDSGTIDSVAVLPFVNASGDPDNEYFSDGITEELLDALARIEGLRVPARTSSFQFKGRTADVREVGQRLNVGAVLEGSVRRTENRVRITARLNDARTGYLLWSESYDRELTDLFAVQDEIAANIVDALRLRLARGADAVTRSGRTASIDAHDLYLLGRHHFHRRGAESLRQAERHFTAAIEASPDYADAWAGLALTNAVLPLFDPAGKSVEQATRDGRAAAERALRIDPSNAAAHAALGQIAMNYEWDWQAAERHYTRAVALAPGDATARMWRAEVLVVRRHADAPAEMEAAFALDPLSPIMGSVTALAHLLVSRDFIRSAEFWQRAAAIDAEFPLVREMALLPHVALQQWEEVRPRLLRLASTPADSTLFSDWVDAAAQVGAGRDPGPALRQRALTAAARYGAMVSIGEAGAVLMMGPVDADAALNLLTAIQDDPQYRQRVMWVGSAWFFDPLRADPRFVGHQERLGL
jgi:adenylate cyclase